MELGAVFLLLAAFFVVAMFVAKPFLERRYAIPNKKDDISALLADQEKIVSLLKDLDADFSLGKIPAREYPEARASLLRQGAEILRRLDETKNTRKNVADVELEEMISARRIYRKENAAGLCPDCGRPLLPADRVCPYCHRALP